MLMQLTDLEGRPVGVDPATVTSVQPHRWNPTGAIETVVFTKPPVAVRETVEEVIAKVNSFGKPAAPRPPRPY